MLSKNKWATAGFQRLLISLQNGAATLFESDRQLFRVDNNLYAGRQAHQIICIRQRIRFVEIIDSYGFLGTEKDTAAASTGLAPISEMALEVGSIGVVVWDLRDRPVEILADKHEASDQLLVLTGTEIQDATMPSFSINTSSRDLLEHVSAG